MGTPTVISRCPRFCGNVFLLDRVEHECRNRFAGQGETHLGSSAFPTSIGRVFLLGETWRTGDRPVETAALYDFFHSKRITHVVSHDKTGDPIGNTREMRCSRENDEPFHSRTVHGPSSRKGAVVEH